MITILHDYTGGEDVFGRKSQHLQRCVAPQTKKVENTTGTTKVYISQERMSTQDKIFTDHKEEQETIS